MKQGKNHIDLKRAIFSGGGTGGHIYPAIAVAKELQKRVPGVEILFVGALGKMEMQKVPEAGFRIEGLNIAGIQRKLTLKNLLVPFKVLSSLWKARKILREFKPDVVVGFGGYASGPLLRVASKMNLPSVIQEQNSHAGMTNKILAKSADRICVSYEGMQKYFPSEKMVVTGNPVREEIKHIRDIDRSKALDHFELDSRLPVILVLGGSLGARTINNATLHGIKENDLNDIHLLWQTGRLYHQEMLEKSSELAVRNVKIWEFIREMELAYAAADIIISRAGALSISELTLVGKPVIFVPSPNVAEDHQTKNAMALVNKNAALMISDAEAEESMIKTAIELLKDTAKRKSLSEAILKEAKPGATGDIVDQILDVVTEGELQSESSHRKDVSRNPVEERKNFEKPMVALT